MENDLSDTHYPTYHADNEEPKVQQQRIDGPQWSPQSALPLSPGAPQSPTPSEIDELNLAIEMSLGLDDSTISSSSSGLPNDPLHAQFANLSLSLSAPISTASNSFDDSPPHDHSSPPNDASPPVRNALVRSYAMVESDSEPEKEYVSWNNGTMSLVDRTFKKPNVAKMKTLIYSCDDPTRQWKPHVRFKQEKKRREQPRASLQRSGAVAFFAPHHQGLWGRDCRAHQQEQKDRTSELEMMLNKISIMDNRRRARKGRLVLPPVDGLPYDRSASPSPPPVPSLITQMAHFTHSTSRDMHMDERSEEGDGMSVDQMCSRELHDELFGEDDAKFQ